MNLSAAADYLNSQSKFCATRAKECIASGSPEALKFSILADLYGVLAGTILSAMTPANLDPSTFKHLADLDASGPRDK